MNYTENCSNCEFRKDCLDKQSRMHKGRCYIDAIAEKLKIKKRDVFKAMNAYVWFTGLRYTAPNDMRFQEYWQHQSESQKKTYFKNRIVTYNAKLKQFEDYQSRVANAGLKLDDSKIVRVMVAIFNFAYDAWRDGDEVRCMHCGTWIENNAKHNRKYCDECAGTRNKSDETKKIFCIDCGELVWIENKDNKTCRCYDCQTKANKEATRIRVAKYRAKKAATA